MNTQRKASVKKLVVDGKVAVVVASGHHGIGWSTSNPGSCRSLLCFDHEIAQAVLDGDLKKAGDLAKAKCSSLAGGSTKYLLSTYGVDLSGLEGLEVIWIKKGKQFEIVEHCGCETIKIVGEQAYMRA